MVTPQRINPTSMPTHVSLFLYRQNITHRAIQDIQKELRSAGPVDDPTKANGREIGIKGKGGETQASL